MRHKKRCFQLSRKPNRHNTQSHEAPGNVGQHCEVLRWKRHINWTLVLPLVRHVELSAAQLSRFLASPLSLTCSWSKASRHSRNTARFGFTLSTHSGSGGSTQYVKISTSTKLCLSGDFRTRPLNPTWLFFVDTCNRHGCGAQWKYTITLCRCRCE